MMFERPVRRALTPLLAALVAIVVIPLASAISLVGLLAALLDRRARLLRLALMVGFYAALEVVLLSLMLVIWLLRTLGIANENTDMRAVGWALGMLLRAGRVLMGFRVELEEPASMGPFEQDEPILVLARHGGIGDSFVLAHLLITRYRRRPRIVVKRTLAWDPMIDVALTRLGACWVGPSSASSSRDAIAELAASALPGEAVLLFPEGGNWTPRRRLRAIARLWGSGRADALKAAALMEHVLPPKPGGVLGCLNARPEMAVVVVAHTGLDKVTTLNGLWEALPFEVPMRLRWWLAAPAPLDEDGRLDWLRTEWAVVDEWIDASAAQMS
jgi:1-acyl-sn-glycerol-3-phosphate acyltransferase